MRYTLLICCALLLLGSRPAKIKADLIVYNGVVYTVNKQFTISEAFAVSNGNIVEVGTSAVIRSRYQADAQLDAQHKPIYPGFIDAHAHFFNYGLVLQEVDLVGTKSWEEVLQRVQQFAKAHTGSWIIGRGWDQNDWVVKEFPDRARLDELFPDKPVFLTRIDGHAAIANGEALSIAGIRAGKQVKGGEVETKAGRLTGILVDNALRLVSSKIPPPGKAAVEKALLAAQARCFAAGLTTVDDCGLGVEEINFIDSLQHKGKLKMRLYGMVSDEKKNYDYYLRRGPYKTAYLNVRSFKLYADGALGSRGAFLLQPYSDKPGWQGFLLHNKDYYAKIAGQLAAAGFQMCTHAIGDAANRIILDVYAQVLKGKNDRRWRIEHAQVVNANDFGKFAAYSIIPSVQPTHATSDMYWAGMRLGAYRLKGAYAYQQLLQQNGWIALGTDFPVEDIQPLLTFYAAVVRKDPSGYPAGGFQMENALTREQALRGMTIWAAKSNFEEKEKGSIEPGKYADFVMLDQDIMKVSPAALLAVKVLATYSGGKPVYVR